MAYLSSSAEIRDQPSALLDGAKSAICVGLCYQPHEPAPPAAAANGEHSGAASGSPFAAADAVALGGGRIARYARGRDYHYIMHRMLNRLLALMRQRIAAPFAARVCVDTLPLLEKELARAAGLGWMGKNTLTLDRRLGSYFCLGELLTTLDLPADQPVTDHCGTCTRCLDACPTQAFIAPYQLDASRCIAYFTIEHRGVIDPHIEAKLGDWVFGCDVCQEVCPFNQQAPPATHAELATPRVPARLPLLQLQSLSSGEYRRLTRGSALRRATVKMWRRNAAIAARNQARRAR